MCIRGPVIVGLTARRLGRPAGVFSVQPREWRHFDDHEAEAGRCLDANLPLPAYDQVLKCSHMFNLLDSRRAIAVTDRQAYILRMRALAMRVARMMVGEDDA